MEQAGDGGEVLDTEMFKFCGKLCSFISAVEYYHERLVRRVSRGRCRGHCQEGEGEKNPGGSHPRACL